MANNDISRRVLGRKLGLLGVVALFSALFAALFITSTFKDPAVFLQLVVAVFGIGAFFVTNVGQLGENFSGRGTVFLASSLISTALVAGALVGVNYIAVKKPKSWDLTKDQVFTLSDQTTTLLAGLKDDVEIYAFYATAEPAFAELDGRLRQYKEHTDKLKVSFLDPSKHLAEVKQFNISTTGPRVIFKQGTKEVRAKELTEEALTNALAELTRGASKKIYLSKGHGERDVADPTERGMKYFVENLKSDGYLVEEILLADHKEMPADAQALIIAGPTTSLSTGEATLVHEWVEKKGGRLLAMIDPTLNSGLETKLATWGISVDADEVIDPEAQQPEFAIAQAYADHPITAPRSTAFQLATIFPLARSISKTAAPEGWTITELAKSGPRAWGETEAINGGTVQYDVGKDIKGPVTLAIAATHGTGESESRVVVVGNSSFVANGFFKIGGNRDFALNAAAWVAHEESKIAIHPRSRQSNRLFLSAEQKHTMMIFALDLLPFTLLFAGLFVWQTRKSR